MLVSIWTRNDESGLLDAEFRDGDVFQTYLDSFEVSLGTQEKKSWLFIKVPDPANMAAVRNDFGTPEYSPGPSQGEENVIRRMRKYRLDWRAKFTQAEIAIIEDANETLPDGSTTNGGTVTAGVVSGLFTIQDFIRK